MKVVALRVHAGVAVDPDAREALVNQIIAKESGLTTEMAVTADALGLLLRQSNHHYPALFVYANGKFGQHVYPGVETVAKYGAVIVGQIQSLRAK